ncbi:MAG: ZPR1 zinc finger domain-containing protein [Candidatus Thermoplasmatota archaeon]|nr:ZPR1 zinc finger domain-containing protein [Candidatus Thermoplasmatota archaeon]
MNISTEQMMVPYFGEMVISTIICPRCGFRSSDIIPVETRKPKRYSVVLGPPERLDLRVVRSGTSTVRVPEIGARIDPGRISEGYVTNVEGILRRIRDILIQMRDDMDRHPDTPDIEEKRAKASELLMLLDGLMDGSLPEGKQITLVIEDPMGNSAIISPEEGMVTEEILTEEEIAQLLGPMSGMDPVTSL